MASFGNVRGGIHIGSVESDSNGKTIVTLIDPKTGDNSLSMPGLNAKSFKGPLHIDSVTQVNTVSTPSNKTITPPDIRWVEEILKRELFKKYPNVMDRTLPHEGRINSSILIVFQDPNDEIDMEDITREACKIIEKIAGVEYKTCPLKGVYFIGLKLTRDMLMMIYVPIDNNNEDLS